MAANEVKVNPAEIKKTIQQMSNDLAAVDAGAGKVKCEISKNTGQSVVDFGKKVTEIGTKMTAYTGKFRQNLAALGRAVDMVEEMDKSLKNAIKGQSTSAKIIEKQKKEKKASQKTPVGTYDYKPSTSTSTSVPKYSYNTQNN